MVPAPEPSNIIWENLETGESHLCVCAVRTFAPVRSALTGLCALPGRCSRCLRKTLTTMVTLFLLAVSFMFIYVAQQEKVVRV